MARQNILFTVVIIIFIMMSTLIISCSQANRKNMQNIDSAYLADSVNMQNIDLAYLAGYIKWRNYSTMIQSLNDVNIPDIFFDRYFLEKTESKKELLSKYIEQKHLTYSSIDNENITIIMTLFSTPEKAVEGLIKIAESYKRNKSRRYWMPGMYTRMIYIGDMFAPGEGATALFARKNVVIDIVASQLVPLENIAEEIDREICQGELDYIISNMDFESYNSLIPSLDKINLPKNYVILSSHWGSCLPKEYKYLLNEIEFTDRNKHYTYIEHKSGRKNKLYIQITLYSTPEDARKSVLMEHLKGTFWIDIEKETIGDISLWDSLGILFSRNNVAIHLFSTAENPTHEILPIIQKIDLEITTKSNQ